MARRFEGRTLVVASHNPGKTVEIRDLLEGLVPQVSSAGELGLPEPEETGSTFAENACLKARLAAERSALPAIADDSGMAVAALGGAPGIYSARWGGQDRNFMRAMERVHQEIGANPDRSAAFICVLALAWPDGHCEAFEGRIEGTLVWPPRGTRGFGYDPMFLPQGGSETFGEMAPQAKHAISHRALAFRKLIEACFVPMG
jgi:XTP/dITP diphosphohydrolase